MRGPDPPSYSAARICVHPKLSSLLQPVPGVSPHITIPQEANYLRRPMLLCHINPCQHTTLQCEGSGGEALEQRTDGWTPLNGMKALHKGP